MTEPQPDISAGEASPTIGTPKARPLDSGSLPLAHQAVLTAPAALPVVQRQILETASEPSLAPTKLVAPKVVRPASASTIQRSVASSGTRMGSLPLAKIVSRAEQKVQRAETPPTGGTSPDNESGTTKTNQTSETKKSEPDLLALARQIYPVLKRMLAVERQRR
jgi:hypothetical protein